MVHTQLTVRPPADTWEDDIATAYPDAVFYILAMVPDTDSAHVLLEIVSENVASIVEAFHQYAGMEGDHLQQGDGWAMLQVREDSPVIQRAAQTTGVPIIPPVVVRNGVISFAVHTTREKVTTLVTEFDRIGCSPTVKAIYQDTEFESVISERQWALLSTAIEQGYYEVPRECTLTELADKVGIAKSTCSEVLRNAEQRIITWFVQKHPRSELSLPQYGCEGAFWTARTPFSTDGPTRETAQYRVDNEADPNKVLDVIRNENARELFRHADEPITIPELAEECDLPQSTAYRLTEKLEEAGLFETENGRNPGGNPPARYRRAVEKAQVSLEDTVSIEYV